MEKTTSEKLFDKIMLLEPKKIETILCFFRGKVDTNLTLIQSIEKLPIKYRRDFIVLIKKQFQN